VQVLRTYPVRRPPFPFAPFGERSIARAYKKAIARARRLIYIEDQYLWSEDVAAILAAALERQPHLHLIAVVPPFPDEDGFFSGPPSRVGQLAAVERVKAAAPDRVEFYDLENEAGYPIYVHAKACVIDDVWASVGSDNFNRRSWTNDSELSCAILDETRDEREPRDPAELGDGARTFARDLRMRLWSEHLDVPATDDRLLDSEAGFRLWRDTAERLRLWKRGGRATPRPAGRILPHEPEAVPGWARWWSEPAYRWLVDPDGRPRELRRARGF
jgi:phosphatidylserine/phosphatidylglycerophosphate/cardiolipin synthase-like enzyme